MNEYVFKYDILEKAKEAKKEVLKSKKWSRSVPIKESLEIAEKWLDSIIKDCKV